MSFFFICSVIAMTLKYLDTGIENKIGGMKVNISVLSFTA